jgi:hypothetical protein
VTLLRSSYILVRTVAFDSSPRGWANLCSSQLQRTGGSGARQQHTPGKNGASTPNSFHQVDRVLLRNLLAGCVTYKLCLRRCYGKRNPLFKYITCNTQRAFAYGQNHFLPSSSQTTSHETINLPHQSFNLLAHAGNSRYVSEVQVGRCEHGHGRTAGFRYSDLH